MYKRRRMMFLTSQYLLLSLTFHYSVFTSIFLIYFHEQKQPFYIFFLLRMDLLETVLRSCDAEKYISNFRAHGIDSYVLKILIDEDLKVIGIADEEVRNRILSHCKNLQIPTEKKRDITVDNQYLCLVLSQISVQLNKHFANLSYAIQQRNIDICYIRLRPATLCLESCLMCLENEVNNVEAQILKQDLNKRRRTPTLVLTTIGACAIIIFAFTRYSKWAARMGV